MIKTAIKFQSVATATFLIALLSTLANATVSVKIFSRDEALGETNHSKPRIYIQNIGTETINDFSYRYFFTTESGKTPTLSPYYLPNGEQAIIVPCGSGYYVQYTFTNANLAPGGLLPHSEGNCLGLHYNDWSAWDKTNDFSNNLSLSFQENQNISVYVAGTRIYGNEPEGGGGGGESGYVLREVWTNISGISTDDIPVGATPNITGSQSTLDAPRQFGDNFGVRLRGYITAPTTGNYTFWIASDDYSKLFLSTDSTPANKGTAIASVTGYTSWKQWNKYGSQKSAPRSLVAGTKYYIEVLHKEGDQDDNCSVGWAKPGEGTSYPSEVVPSSVLSPFVDPVVPANPTNLVATAISSQRIDLSWTDASTNELGFEIFMKSGGGPFTSIAMVVANLTSYQITGLTPETQYQFKVRAYNTIGNSDYSNAALATTFAVSTGTVNRELWTGITGIHIYDIPLGTTPNYVNNLTSLETQQQMGDNYGRRIRGYIIPPTTGNYYFWIASDDYSQLWLSTSADPAGKSMIAWVAGYTDYHAWYKYPSQASAAKSLVAGRKYYFEILHKEGNQNDNLSVAWRLGTSGSPTVISGSVLSAYIPPTAPDTPSGLAATPLSASQIDLTWTDNSSNEAGFQIERATGGGSFVQVGTAAANATVFHDGGLTANTQYQYRIRAFNDYGTSDYTSTVSAITLAPSSSPPPPMELASFAVYSSQKTTLKDRCVFSGGGAVGSDTLVEIFPEATVNGNVVSGGNIILKSQAEVNGDATAAGTITLEAGATVSGDTAGNTPVAFVEIPEIASIPTGTEKIKLNPDSIRPTPLSPGYYEEFFVGARGKITLVSGKYTFTKFYLEPDATVELDVEFSDMVDIEVSGDFELSDRSKVVFADEGYVPFIRFYTNDANTVRIGCDVQFNGTLTAPHGNIAMYSRAQCSGALYGKTITIEPDAVILSDMTNPESDNDGDGIANVLEVIMGTGLNDSTDFIPIAIPSKAWIDNSQDVTVTYDFSRYFPDYAFATAVSATFPAGSLVRPYIPMLPYVSNMPAEGDTFSVPDHAMRGRYIGFRPENSIVSGQTFNFRFPLAAWITWMKRKVFQLIGSNWTEIAAAPPAGGDEDEGIDVDPGSGGGSLAAGDEVLQTTTTLYFDEGCVFSKSQQIVLQYQVVINDAAMELERLTLKVEYTDLTTSTSSYKQVDLTATPAGNRQNYFGSGKFIFENPVRIDNCIFISKYTGQQELFYTQDCGTNFMIDGTKVLQLLAKTSAGLIQVVQPLAQREQIALYYTSEAFTFETANFGDGRIITDIATTVPDFAYEYFLKDHLGSTRMVMSDDGTVTEAVMYQPYGMMSEVPGATASAIPVREKFTGKEFDQEGEDAGNGVPGIKAYYFGRRYYDPEVGGWGSTDPKGQFWSPYSYA
ncbi:MAG: fibronectin type III domain-containing protein, partial [Chitinispirillaceae bacterium]|nr:fibronectin type III domain-containing protein [Chitinispirillaceae bacterium]